MSQRGGTKRRHDALSASSSATGESQRDEERKERHYMLRVGDEFDRGRYRVQRQLGKGTFGRVVEMLDVQEDRTVAVKVVRAVEKYTHEAAIEAEIIEAVQRTLPRSSGFPIARLLRTFEHRGHYCIVLDPMGPSLYHRLRDIRHALEASPPPAHRGRPVQHTGSYFPLSQIATITRDCFEALAHLHKIKLTHTDLKPENVLLVENLPHKHATPTRFNVSLVDFGGAT